MADQEAGAPIKYVINPLTPFPKHWHDRISDIRVMAGPVEGYLMVRRTGGIPFAIRVSKILNAERHPIHGPFTLGRKPKVKS